MANEINKVFNSFVKFIKDDPNFTMYVYTDSSYNIEEGFVVRSKINLPLGTETTFIVQVDPTGAGVFYDAVNPNDTDYYKYRYVYRFDGNGNPQYIRIDSYDNTTGQIVLENPFGEPVTTSDELQIVVLDSLFIKDLNSMPITGNLCFREEHLRLDLILNTKEDSDKSKMRNFIQTIKNRINTNRMKFPLYADDLVTVLGYGDFRNSGEYNETIDSASQLIKYLGSLVVKYRVNYFG